MADRPTIKDAVRIVLTELAPNELNYLSACGGVIFGGGTAARHAMHAALAGPHGSSPTGFAAALVEK